MITLSQYLAESDKTNLMIINEGGLAGHLSHLYEDEELTFAELKNILQNASTGKLHAVEKTDGQNIYLSFNMEDQMARAARNKGNIRAGGVTPDQFAEQFKDRPENIRKSFGMAIQSFENAAKRLAPEMQYMFFGPNANIFYNCEIVNPLTSNVIKYNKNYVIIHNSGHIINEPFQKQNGRPILDRDVSQNLNLLNQNLKIVTDEFPEDYHFTVDPIVQLKNISDDTFVKQALLKINAIMRQYRLTDKNTIGDYLSRYIQYGMQRNGIDLPPALVKQIVAKILSTPGTPNVLSIYKALKQKYPPETLQAVKNLIGDKDNVFKNAIRPLEEIIHDFSVQILKGVQSAFVLHPSAEVKRLQDEVAKSIQAIQSGNNETAHEILKNQLEKLKGVDQITSSAEGIVFNHNNKIYKFTGNFAPVNQLLGFFKYGAATRGVS